jgi:hypothetical protein
MTNRASLHPLANVAMVLEILLGVGAVCGGMALMAGPRGEILPLPVAALAESPFSNYFAPGAILFAVLGLGPLGAAVCTRRRHPLAPFLLFAAGAALLMWLIVEIAVVGYSNRPPLQAVYLGLGVVMTSVGVAWMAETRRSPLSVLAAFPLALLLAVASLSGILFPATYARETASWAAQAVGQDWVDLILAGPWLVVTGLLAQRGSPRALLLLAGGFLYTFYTFAIYGFAVHFNGLFLVYCAGLGLSFFVLAGMARQAFREQVTRWCAEAAPMRGVGVLLIIIGSLFAAAWLGEILPAIAHDAVPTSVAESGVATNPVHVLDLSFLLPIHIIVGISLLRRRSEGYTLAAVVLGFGVLMAAAIAGLTLSMRGSGFHMSWIVFGATTILSAAEAAALALLLRALRPSP